MIHPRKHATLGLLLSIKVLDGGSVIFTACVHLRDCGVCVWAAPAFCQERVSAECYFFPSALKTAVGASNRIHLEVSLHTLTIRAVQIVPRPAPRGLWKQ